MARKYFLAHEHSSPPEYSPKTLSFQARSRADPSLQPFGPPERASFSSAQMCPGLEKVGCDSLRSRLIVCPRREEGDGRICEGTPCHDHLLLALAVLQQIPRAFPTSDDATHRTISRRGVNVLRHIEDKCFLNIFQSLIQKN